jgi:hypothetical protein
LLAGLPDLGQVVAQLAAHGMLTVAVNAHLPAGGLSRSRKPWQLRAVRIRLSSLRIGALGYGGPRAPPFLISGGLAHDCAMATDGRGQAAGLGLVRGPSL